MKKGLGLANPSDTFGLAIFRNRRLFILKINYFPFLIFGDLKRKSNIFDKLFLPQVNIRYEKTDLA